MMIISIVFKFVNFSRLNTFLQYMGIQMVEGDYLWLIQLQLICFALFIYTNSLETNHRDHLFSTYRKFPAKLLPTSAWWGDASFLEYFVYERFAYEMLKKVAIHMCFKTLSNIYMIKLDHSFVIREYIIDK